MSTLTCETPTQVCAKHPDMPAVWKCVSCQSYYCEHCVKISHFRTVTIESCNVCGEMCKKIGGDERRDPSFFALLPSAFGYPLKGKGLAFLIMGFVFFSIMQLLSCIPFYGRIWMIVGSGYLTAYLFKIICASSMGKHEMPNLPDVSDIHADIVAPLVSVFMTTLISFGPAGVFALVGLFKWPVCYIFAVAFLIFGAFYYPMALIATALQTSLHYHPFEIFSAIMKVIGPYVVACGIFFLIPVINLLVAVQLSMANVFLGFVLSGFLSFYFTIVETRILGLIYYCNEKRLGWF